jgi:acyl-CoA reductase-like NAD-dependent aldehyde dehydrogenase
MLREPAGVAGLIVPWNAPAVLLVRALGPALAAGCTAVVKPAMQTVLFSAAMLRELDKADVPKGVVNMVAETEHAGAALLASSHDVDVICFTGSTATGKKVMAAATDSIKKLSLELGGKSCCLVFDDADIADVAGKIATAATIISGQQCTAARRVLVHESRANAMREALTAMLANLRVGSGLDTANHMGPLIDHKARTVVGRQIEEACSAADRVLLRGSRLNGAHAKGSFLTPTLVEHRNTTAPFCQEEIFGPFVVIETFADESEAVARANHTVFGLSASIWTHDIGRAMRVARALRDGTVWINDHNKLFAEAETGGYRQSGLGRLHGYEALADFTETKHIYLSAGVVPPR